MSLELLAPAKVNLTLEVLGRRSDGYHEIVTLIQTIDLCDALILAAGHGIELEVVGDAVAGVPEGEANLAAKAAHSLKSEAGRTDLGAHIRLAKQIPAAMGLGGGSSDAAAVLRGLNQLWDLRFTTDHLARVAATLGSDVPFFLYCGTAVCRGHGEIVEPMADLR